MGQHSKLYTEEDLRRAWRYGCSQGWGCAADQILSYIRERDKQLYLDIPVEEMQKHGHLWTELEKEHFHQFWERRAKHKEWLRKQRKQSAGVKVG